MLTKGQVILPGVQRELFIFLSRNTDSLDLRSGNHSVLSGQLDSFGKTANPQFEVSIFKQPREREPFNDDSIIFKLNHLPVYDGNPLLLKIHPEYFVNCSLLYKDNEKLQALTLQQLVSNIHWSFSTQVNPAQHSSMSRVIKDAKDVFRFSLYDFTEGIPMGQLIESRQCAYAEQISVIVKRKYSQLFRDFDTQGITLSTHDDNDIIVSGIENGKPPEEDKIKLKVVDLNILAQNSKLLHIERSEILRPDY